MSKSNASEEDRKCYEELCATYNKKKAKSLGLVRVRDVPKMDVEDEIELAEASEAVVGFFDFDKMDDIRGDCA
eukprot:scaffold9008_cov56-Cyclotella_meneghiniana.AAC.8